jgi:hypothetical protein
MKKIIILIIVLALISLVGYLSLRNQPENTQVTETSTSTLENGENTEGENEDPDGPGITVIGQSVENRDISAYHFGTGETELLFVGGIHGGYSWNTALVAYELMDYLEENTDTIPQNIKVTVVPVLNPDGLNSVVGSAGRFAEADVPDNQDETIPGRFNGNNVDLNRNFDCDWQAEGTWQSRAVSGGDSVFSEPEAQAIRDYVNNENPTAVVVWYSAAGGVFASNCHGGVSAETTALTNAYAEASGYPAYQSFDFYEITGDMVNWLAKENIPAISVLLTNHNNTEWDINRAGIEALLEYYQN